MAVGYWHFAIGRFSTNLNSAIIITTAEV